ncbi:hypothetical protein [Aeromonas popoffii]|uniref:hypothetical protein n=1 Tax=Aeromonas popoffii TaxID=70856 RepID=UPI0005AA3685|nr:hypothetical protein [Aeromonas popoffii]
MKKTLMHTALVFTSIAFASSALAGYTGFKTMAIGDPITAVTAVNDGMEKYDWRTDNDQDFRGTPKLGEGFLGLPAIGPYDYAIYYQKLSSFGGPLVEYKNSSPSTVKQAKADFRAWVEKATKALGVKPELTEYNKDNNEPFFECVTSNLCGSYSANYHIGDREVSLWLMRGDEGSSVVGSLRVGMSNIK